MVKRPAAGRYKWMHAAITMIFLVPVSAGDIPHRSLAESLLSDNAQVRRDAVRELATEINNADAKGSTVQVDNVYEIFLEVCRGKDLPFACDVARLLSRLPVDERLLAYATRVVAGPGSGSPRKTELLGSLLYLERHDKRAFEAYFAPLHYDEIDQDLLDVLGGSAAVHSKQESYYRKTLQAYLAWKPPANISDETNPYRPKILKFDRNTLGLILRDMYGDPKSAIPVNMMWLIGEIGTMGDVSILDILLREYGRSPSYRTAITVGSCTGSLGIEQIFQYGFDEDTLRGLLRDVYGDRWPQVQSMSLGQIKSDWMLHWSEVQKSCRLRSIPQAG